MTILFHTHLTQDYSGALETFTLQFPEHRFLIASTRRKRDELIPQADVLVDHRIDEKLLDRTRRLQWIFIPFTGVNSLDLPALAQRGIGVCNNHGNAAAVAERALALALAALGRVVEFDQGLRKGDWHRNPGERNPFQFWSSLSGRRTAILGCGAIGRHIVRYLQPFTSDIIGYRRQEGRVLPGFREMTTHLHQALDGAELCFVALPSTPATTGLLGKTEIALMTGATIVNVSRGDILREEDFFNALRDRRLAAAGLDVWWTYPEHFADNTLPSRFPYHELPHVVLSPHAGSHAEEGKRGQLQGVFENLQHLFQTGRPRDIADPHAGY